MKSINFLGAAGTVTGSSYLLTKDSAETLLIDLGMFQGGQQIHDLNYQPVNINYSTLDAVLLTHAHLDHCGRLPFLVQNGYRGKIYMTEPTRKLLQIVLLDAAHIAEHEQMPKLFTQEDIYALLEHCEVINYHQPITIGSFTAEYYDAGHIVGSASIKVTDTQSHDGIETILFSGDIGNYPEEIVKESEYFDHGDIVLLESTYGGRYHQKQDANAIFTAEIEAITKSGGVLLIPAFSIERTQELLHRFDHLVKSGKVSEKVKFYLDSPMARKVTDIYRHYMKLFNAEMQQHGRSDDPFDFPGLKIIEDMEESKQISRDSGPKVIIAGSGMMNGGRILSHAMKYLPLTTTRLLFVGYQAEETLGRLLVDGAKEVFIKNMTVPVRATVTNLSSLSAHADEPKLLNWLSKVKDVKKVFLTHGEDKPREDLKAKIHSDLRLADVVMPHLNEVHKL